MWGDCLSHYPVVSTHRHLVKKKNADITTAAKANPLEAHSLDTLDELGDKVVGKGFKKMRQGYELTPKQIEKSIKLLQNMTR